MSNNVVLIGNGNTSVTVTAFSADYENYLVVFNRILSTTGDPSFELTFGSTVTGYFGVTTFQSYDGAANGTTPRNNGSGLPAGYIGANNYSGNMTVFRPFMTQRTSITGQDAGDLYNGTYNGMLANNTSYTSFKIVAAGTSFASGSIRVYGYRN
jgi:hypothetical protein